MGNIRKCSLILGFGAASDFAELIKSCVAKASVSEYNIFEALKGLLVLGQGRFASRGLPFSITVDEEGKRGS
jgi:hypothetical protein